MDVIDGLLEPIEGENPAGPSLRYEPVYAEIKQAREAEDDNIPQGEWKRELKVADFPLVVKRATEVLETRSKDLQVAAWLTEAWTREKGFQGLAEGLVLLRRLMEEFWDHVHPEIDEDGDLEFRAVPLEWVGLSLRASVDVVPLTEAGLALMHHRESRAVPPESEAESDEGKARTRSEAMEAGRTTPEEFLDAVEGSSKAFYKELVPALEAAREALSELESFCDERFGDVTPNLIPLRDMLSEVHRIAEQQLARKLKADPDPVEPEPTSPEADGDGEVDDEARAAAGGGGAGAGTGGGAPAEIRSDDDAMRAATEAARFLRQARPSDPTPYLILRGLRWGELRRGGEGVDPKLLTAPPTSVRTRLKGHALDAQWEQLLEACEEVMATPHGRGWLDLQRYAVEACEGLGSEYDLVAQAVKGALATLLKDLPGLADATLMDDSPTANPETRAWLGSQIVPKADGEEDEPAFKPVRDDHALSRQVERLRKSRPQQAIQLLMRQAQQEKSARARFLRRSQAAQIMVESGLEPVALPILKEMSEQIERHGLEEWEDGETVALPLGLLYRCMNKMNGDEHERQELYLRICRLDPMQAMAFDTGTGGDGEEGV
jgi:type VI secretion system protein ImpA